MSKQKVKVLISNSHNPWFNLATEDWIFKDLNPDTHVLFLWRNQETVVIGRFQNPWTECRVKDMDDDGVILARRQSGGGAVFHDLGNTNFTFLSSKENYSKEANTRIITNAIKQFGIDAYASGRNDILITHPEDKSERKISGSAFKEKKDRSFHHGTLLIDADLTKLGNYLNPDKKKLEAKGIKSVRSRVANLSHVCSDITHESLSKEIISEFFKYYQNECEVQILDEEALRNTTALMEYYNHLKDWNWRFGETPKFTHTMEERFTWGGIEAHLNVKHGVILAAKIYSDSLHPEMIEMLNKTFVGKHYNEVGLTSALEETKIELPMIGEYLDELKSWLVKECS
jgi:lipoate-protein ligase A